MPTRDRNQSPTWRREALLLLTYEPVADAAASFEVAATLADHARYAASTASRCVPSDEATGIAVPRPRHAAARTHLKVTR